MAPTGTGEQAQLMDVLKKEVRAMLITAKEGLTPAQLEEQYMAMVCKPLPFQDLGFQSTLQLVSNMPEVVQVSSCRDGTLILKAIADDTTKGIARLVACQKGRTRPKTKRTAAKANAAASSKNSKNPQHSCWSARTPVLPGTVKAELQDLLSSSPILLKDLEKAFLRHFGQAFPYRQYGFSSVHEALRSVSDSIAVVEQAKAGSLLVLRKYLPSEVEGEEVPQGEAQKEEMLQSEAQKEEMLQSEAQKEEMLQSEAQKEEMLQSEAQKEEMLQSEAQKEEMLQSEAQKEEMLQSEAQKEEMLQSEAQKEEMLQSEAQKEEMLQSEAQKEEMLQSEAQKEEMLQSEAQKEEMLQSEAQKEEMLQSEAQKEEMLQSEAQKEEMLQSEAQKEEMLQSEAQKEEMLQSEAQKEEMLQSEAQKEEVPQGEAQKEEVPQGEAQDKEVPQAASAAEMPPLEPICETDSSYQTAHLMKQEPVKAQAVDWCDHLKQPQDSQQFLPNKLTQIRGIPPDAVQDSSLCSLPLLKRGCLVGVIVEFVVSPSQFYVRICSREASYRLQDLMVEMRHIYSHKLVSDQYIMPDSAVQPGQLCCVTVSKWWYRVIIHRVISDQEVEVFYADYGYLQVVQKSWLRFLKWHYLKLPAQAVLCSLAWVKPMEGVWSPAATLLFKKLCCSKELVGIVDEYVDGVLHLFLCDTSTREDVYFHCVLQDMEYADVCGENIPSQEFKELNPLALYVQPSEKQNGELVEAELCLQQESLDADSEAAASKLNEAEPCDQKLPLSLPSLVLRGTAETRASC